MLDTRKCVWILVIGFWVRARGRKLNNDTYEMIFTPLLCMCLNDMKKRMYRF